MRVERPLFGALYWLAEAVAHATFPVGSGATRGACLVPVSLPIIIVQQVIELPTCQALAPAACGTIKAVGRKVLPVSVLHIGSQGSVGL